MRARIAVRVPAQLQIEATLAFRREGGLRTVDLGRHSLGNPGLRNLRLPLPAALHKTLPLGTTVRLRLAISAATGCGQPELSARSLTTKVVQVMTTSPVA